MKIRPKKFYLPPPNNGSNFNELFKSIAASGIGQPIGADGFASGPWTPDLLAGAISQVEGNHAGIELRTVQIWFQDNDKGISSDNIRWLARVLGCDDHVATSEWQKELSAANSRLTAHRRAKRKASIIELEKEKDRTSSASSILVRLANKAEKVLHSGNPLSLPIIMWAAYSFLGFMTFVFGAHHVTYSPHEGLDKQIGFLWAPHWTILEAIILPLYIILIYGLLEYWKNTARPLLNLETETNWSSQSWMIQVHAFSKSIFSITLICIVFVFFIQWLGVFLRLQIVGDPGNFSADWNLLALVRPDIISKEGSIFLSMSGLAYTSAYIWIYLMGLLFHYIVAQDFFENCSNQMNVVTDELRASVFSVATKLSSSVFRASILGIWLAICIRLQIFYLKSDAENIIQWLLVDFTAAIGLGNQTNGLLPTVHIAAFTTFLMSFIACFIYFACLSKLHGSVEKIITYSSNTSPDTLRMSRALNKKLMSHWGRMTCVLILIFVGFLSTGLFTGFTILLAICVVVSVYTLYNPMMGSSISFDERSA